METLKSHKIGDLVYTGGIVGTIKEINRFPALTRANDGKLEFIEKPEVEWDYKVEWFSEEPKLPYVRRVWFNYYEIESLKEQLGWALNA